MCVVLKCAIVAVVRQHVRIWLQRYEKNIKPVPFSVGIDVFSVSCQCSHYSSLTAQRHEFSPSVVTITQRMLKVSDKRTYLSVGQYSYEAYVLLYNKRRHYRVDGHPELVSGSVRGE